METRPNNRIALPVAHLLVRLSVRGALANRAAVGVSVLADPAQTDTACVGAFSYANLGVVAHPLPCPHRRTGKPIHD
jgi:hypothetical protein